MSNLSILQTVYVALLLRATNSFKDKLEVSDKLFYRM